MMAIHRLALPGIFWRDHYDRCGDHNGARNVIKDDDRVVTVELDDEALADLKSDAEYYVDGVDFGGERHAWRSLTDSAKRTIKSIKRQAPEWRSPWERGR